MRDRHFLLLQERTIKDFNGENQKLVTFSTENIEIYFFVLHQRLSLGTELILLTKVNDFARHHFETSNAFWFTVNLNKDILYQYIHL